MNRWMDWWKYMDIPPCYRNTFIQLYTYLIFVYHCISICLHIIYPAIRPCIYVLLCLCICLWCVCVQTVRNTTALSQEAFLRRCHVAALLYQQLRRLLALTMTLEGQPSVLGVWHAASSCLSFSSFSSSALGPPLGPQESICQVATTSQEAEGKDQDGQTAKGEANN